MHSEASANEPIVDPDLRIIDPHHHLWNGAAGIGRYLPAEYLCDADSGHYIVATVFMECGTHYRDAGPSQLRCVGETEFAAATRDQFLCAIELFTPARCMFESNFPIDRQVTSHRALWNGFKRLSAQFSRSERASLFHDTAARAYSIAPVAPVASVASSGFLDHLAE